MTRFNCETEQFEEVYGIPQHIVFGWWLYATYDLQNDDLPTASADIWTFKEGF